MRYFFVDTENVGEYSFVKEMNVSSNDTIILFISENSRRIKLEDLRLINTSRAKIVYEDVYTGEANALDFQLVACMSLMISKTEEYDECIVVSNDNGYKMPTQYLSEKANRNISILKTNNSVVSTYNKVDISEALAETIIEAISEEVEFASEESNIKNEILKIIEQSKALSKLHNNLKNKFGNEDGRNIYMKLKPHIKTLYKTTEF